MLSEISFYFFILQNSGYIDFCIISLSFQAAFLSALAGIEVAKAAACAAVTTLCEADYETSRLSLGSRAWNARQHGVLLVKNSAQAKCSISLLHMDPNLSWDFLKY